jgi:hypothetical protein
MRKRIFCAAALLCGASLANAQGFASETATGQPLGTYFSNQGYYTSAPGYAQAPAMNGYAGVGFPGAASGYPVMPANYGYGYGYGMPVMGQLPAQPSMPMVMPPMMPQAMGADLSGVPMAHEGDVIDGGGFEVFPKAKHRFWINADYTLTWIKPQTLAFPLVTIGAAADPDTGALGQPGTAVIFGDNINQNQQNGFMIDTGFFLDESRVFSLEWVGHFYEQAGSSFAKEADGTGIPVIARPYFDTFRERQFAAINSFPGGLTGGVLVDSQTTLFRTEFNTAYNICGDGWSAAALLGVRYMRLGESLTISDRLNNLIDNFVLFDGQGVSTTDVITDFDRFRTTNNFYGGQIGGRVRWDAAWVFLSAYGKLGLGVTEQTVDISGATTLVRGTGGQTTLPGGVLALPSNIGNRSRTVFSYSPEAGINVGLKLTQHLALSAGYSFTYWSHVVRPGQQFDGVINSSQIPTSNSYGQTAGATRPVFNFNDESIYLHTLSLGLNINY